MEPIQVGRCFSPSQVVMYGLIKPIAVFRVKFHPQLLGNTRVWLWPSPIEQAPPHPPPLKSSRFASNHLVLNPPPPPHKGQHPIVQEILPQVGIVVPGFGQPASTHDRMLFLITTIIMNLTFPIHLHADGPHFRLPFHFSRLKHARRAQTRPSPSGVISKLAAGTTFGKSGTRLTMKSHPLAVGIDDEFAIFF